MKRDNWLVTERDTRSGNGGAGVPHKCFYCTAATGTEHDAECVCRRRTVVVRMTVEHIVVVPESWNSDQINFHRNDSSWCVSNAFRQLADLSDSSGQCHCGHTEVEYLRDATEDDHELYGYGFDELLDDK